MNDKNDLQKLATTFLPTPFDDFMLHAFENRKTGVEHVALTTPYLYGVPVVRIQSQCLTGEIFSSLRCDCKDQLEQTLYLIGQSKSGICIYLQGQEGRGIGLGNKIRAYALQDQGLDTVEANHCLGFEIDQRKYLDAVQILKLFNINQLKLVTNNPLKIKALEVEGLNINECISLKSKICEHNRKYLNTKRDKLSHKIELEMEASHGA